MRDVLYEFEKLINNKKQYYNEYIMFLYNLELYCTVKHIWNYTKKF